MSATAPIRPDRRLPWPVPLAAVDEIAFSESGDDGPELVAYLCPAGVPTIGWGETDGVHLGDTCTREQADQWLLEDLQDRARQVLALLKVPTAPNQLGGLVVLAYNIGIPALAGSTVLKRHNAGDTAGAAQAFDLWNKARNPRTRKLEVMPGLVARRKREAALYLAPEPGQRKEPMPQAVQAEPAMSSSTTAVAAGSGVLVTAGSAVTDLLDAIKTSGTEVASIKAPAGSIKDFAVETLGIPAGAFSPGFALVCAVIFGVILWRRLKQRREGLA